MNKHITVEPAEMPLVLVECIWTDRLFPSVHENYFPERDKAHANLKTVIADIRSGELEHVHAIYEVGRAHPITEDVAREILELELAEFGKVREHLDGFLLKTLGMSRVMNAEIHERWARMA